MNKRAVSHRVARKEWLLFFSSPVAWPILVGFAAASLVMALHVEPGFARDGTYLHPLFQWLPLLLIPLCAAIAAPMWSAERKLGTLEQVITLPQSISRFVFAKYWAAACLLALALLATTPLPILLALTAGQAWGPIVIAYFATLLLGSAYLGIGLLVSACSDKPLVSFIAAVVLCAFFYLPGSALFADLFDDAVRLHTLSAGWRFRNALHGVLDLRDLYYYVSATGVFLVLNVYALERVRWSRSRARSRRHRLWHAITALLLINLLLANVWLHRVPMPRLGAFGESLHDPATQLSRPAIEYASYTLSAAWLVLVAGVHRQRRRRRIRHYQRELKP